MKKELRKKFKIILIVLLLLIVFSTIVSADSIVKYPGYFKPGNEKVNINAVDNIIGALRLVGTILSVIILAVIGIKFMLGSVEEKAEYKKMMIPYIVGAILLFAGTNLLQIVYSTVKEVGKTQPSYSISSGNNSSTKNN